MRFLILDDEEMRHAMLNRIIKRKFPNSEIDNVFSNEMCIKYLINQKPYHVLFLDYELAGNRNTFKVVEFLMRREIIILKIFVHSSNIEKRDEIIKILSTKFMVESFDGMGGNIPEFFKV